MFYVQSYDKYLFCMVSLLGKLCCRHHAYVADWILQQYNIRLKASELWLLGKVCVIQYLFCITPFNAVTITPWVWGEMKNCKESNCRIVSTIKSLKYARCNAFSTYFVLQLSHYANIYYLHNFWTILVCDTFRIILYLHTHLISWLNLKSVTHTHCMWTKNGVNQKNSDYWRPLVVCFMPNSVVISGHSHNLNLNNV